MQERPAVIRVLAGAFEMSHLPNRAELRLKDLNRVIGYTLSQVKDSSGVALGAVMFFKDLTQVEQLEERERLRDRLASLGEMAAGIAHELKNPLAGIEVMAGLLRRQVPESVDAQSLLADIISEAKLANAIVVQMLEFVRPVRLQVEQTDLAQVLHQAVTLAESKAPRGAVGVAINMAPELPMIAGDQHQLRRCSPISWPTRSRRSTAKGISRLRRSRPCPRTIRRFRPRSRRCRWWSSTSPTTGRGSRRS